jgi:carbon monoxide dehydrogenase subunit G
MEFTAETAVAAGPAHVWTAVRDLSTYPRWFSIVDHAERVDGAEAAWVVDLAGRLGPLKRTKRLRMTRVVDDAGSGHVRFERDDGPGHSPWVLDGTVIDDGDEVRCRVRMELFYGGAFFVPGGDLLLRYEARNAGRRLESLLQRPKPPVL